MTAGSMPWALNIARHSGTHTAVVGAYGAHLAMCTSDADALGGLLERLPPGWGLSDVDIAPEAVSWRVSVWRSEARYVLVDGDGDETVHQDLDQTARALRAYLRRYVGHHSPNLTFIHAGVVASDGRAIMLPGRSFAGKSTLVAALVRAGADYYSDEYALLDIAGLVHQYLEPISLRRQASGDEPAPSQIAAQPPVPIGLMAIVSYTRGGTWAPAPLTPAEALVAVIEHTLPARERPAATLVALRRALSNATLLKAERGEADETAKALLHALNGANG